MLRLLQCFRRFVGRPRSHMFEENDDRFHNLWGSQRKKRGKIGCRSQMQAIAANLECVLPIALHGKRNHGPIGGHSFGPRIQDILTLVNSTATCESSAPNARTMVSETPLRIDQLQDAVGNGPECGVKGRLYELHRIYCGKEGCISLLGGFHYRGRSIAKTTTMCTRCPIGLSILWFRQNSEAFRVPIVVTSLGAIAILG